MADMSVSVTFVEICSSKRCASLSNGKQRGREMKSVGLESDLRANEPFLDRGTESYFLEHFETHWAV